PDVVCAKRGTLTEGRPEVIGVQAAEASEAATLLAWAAALETGSAHPFARAIVAAADGHTGAGIALLPGERHDEPGFGVAAGLRDGDGSIHRLLLGSAAWCGIAPAAARAWRELPVLPAGSPLAGARPGIGPAGQAPADERSVPATAEAVASASEVFLVECLDDAGAPVGV